MSFADLPLASPILKAIAECGYEKPTPIQAEAIPPALAGRDLIASAQTGTGKTAAFMIPTLQRLFEVPAGRPRGPRVLVLTPTRELADQITEATRRYGKYLRVKSITIFGGMPYPKQIRELAKLPDLVVATPGRLIDHLDRGRIKLSGLEVLILDEADRMLDMGFIDDVKKIVAAAPDKRQTLLFGATLDDSVARLGGCLLKDPMRIQVAVQEKTHASIEQRLHVVNDTRHKACILEHLIADSGLTRAIIFSATKRNADSLARMLHAQGHAAAAMHGDMKQSARNHTISAMRSGKIRLLVATDVAARGLDVTGISHVINYDLPKTSEDYINRIGRTGRAGASGVAISLASYKDILDLERIEHYLGQPLQQHVIPGLEPTLPLSTVLTRKASGQGSFSNRRSSRNTRGIHPFHRRRKEVVREWGRN
jgi:superfamily II DNA/RNA helicase